MEGKEARGDVGEGVLEAGSGFEKWVGFAASPEFIKGDGGGKDLFDAETGLAQEVLGGVASVVMEVCAVEGPAVHLGKLAGEEEESDGDVGDVWERDDEESVIGGDGSEASEDIEGVEEVFEDVGADDGVVGFWGEVRGFDGGVIDIAIEGSGVFGPLGIGFDGVDGEFGIMEEASEETLGGADVENGFGSELAKKACNLLMAASGVLVEPVVKHGISSGGRGRI